jgi:hypothetical protein
VVEHRSHNGEISGYVEIVRLPASPHNEVRCNGALAVVIQSLDHFLNAAIGETSTILDDG